MQVSVIFEGQLARPTLERERQMFLDSVTQAVYAEEMGFDRVWAVEHHSLKWFSHMSAPEVFLTWVAAKTSRIRIGHGVVCMPFGYNHPVRVAERVATLDILSNGRLDVGAGRGATKQEMSLCGVDPDRTYQELEEALRILGAVWQEEVFEWHGDLLDISPHEVMPRPVQAPHPPLYMACTHRETLNLAAEYGVGALVFGFAGIDEVRHLRKLYDEARAARSSDRFVSSTVNDHFAALCPSVVLDDADEALKIGARGQRFFAEALHRWYGIEDNPADPNELTDDEDNVQALQAFREKQIVKLHEANIPVIPAIEGHFNIEHAYGDVDRAIAYVDQLAEIGVDEVILLVNMGTIPHEVCMETIRQWGEKVIPYLRQRGA